MNGEGQHVKLQLQKVFGEKHGSLYSLLGVASDAASEDVKRAYRRLALKHHPDRGGDAETFKALSAIHSILTDEVKRKLYDETGEVDGDGHTDLSDESFEFWDNYFRSLFPKVTVEGIQAFSALYKGSTGENGSEHNERQDILDAYVQYEGNFSHIMESVILAEEEDEERITSVISAAIESGEVEAYLAFDEHLASLMNASGGKKKSSKKKQKREASISHSTDEGEAAEKGKKSNKKKKGGANDSIDDLAAMILGGRKKQQNAMSSIFAKYGGAEEDGDEYKISDEAFERTRATLNASKSKKKPKSSKSSKKS